MSRFKPQVSYITKDSLHEHYNSYKPKSKYITKSYISYQELKKELKNILDNNIDSEGVTVVRSRRGQWGEWFEKWKNINDIPTIVKEGWC